MMLNKNQYYIIQNLEMGIHSNRQPKRSTFDVFNLIHDSLQLNIEQLYAFYCEVGKLLAQNPYYHKIPMMMVIFDGVRCTGSFQNIQFK